MWHENSKGQLVRCPAKIQCRLGGEHFPGATQEEADAAREQSLMKNNSAVATVKKESPLFMADTDEERYDLIEEAVDNAGWVYNSASIASGDDGDVVSVNLDVTPGDNSAYPTFEEEELAHKAVLRQLEDELGGNGITFKVTSDTHGFTSPKDLDFARDKDIHYISDGDGYASWHEFNRGTIFAPSRNLEPEEGKIPVVMIPHTTYGDYNSSSHVESSNYKVLQDEYSPDYFVEVGNSDRDGKGIALRLDRKIPQDLYDRLAGLENYPALDDEAVYDEEVRIINESWENHAQEETVSRLADHFGGFETPERVHELLSEEELRGVYDELDSNPVYVESYGTGAIFPYDDAVEILAERHKIPFRHMAAAEFVKSYDSIPAEKWGNIAREAAMPERKKEIRDTLQSIAARHKELESELYENPSEEKVRNYQLWQQADELRSEYFEAARRATFRGSGVELGYDGRDEMNNALWAVANRDNLTQEEYDTLTRLALQ